MGDHVRGAVDEPTTGVRTRAAEQLLDVADMLQSGADTLDHGLTGGREQPRGG